MPTNHINDRHSTGTQRAQEWWPTLVVTNSVLVGLIPFNTREAMPGTGNPADSTVLVKSRLLEENLQPLVY